MDFMNRMSTFLKMSQVGIGLFLMFHSVISVDSRFVIPQWLSATLLVIEGIQALGDHPESDPGDDMDNDAIYEELMSTVSEIRSDSATFVERGIPDLTSDDADEKLFREIMNANRNVSDIVTRAFVSREGGEIKKIENEGKYVGQTGGGHVGLTEGDEGQIVADEKLSKPEVDQVKAFKVQSEAPEKGKALESKSVATEENDLIQGKPGIDVLDGALGIAGSTVGEKRTA